MSPGFSYVRKDIREITLGKGRETISRLVASRLDSILILVITVNFKPEIETGLIRFYMAGNVSVKQVPSPSVLSTLIVPEKDSTSFFVMKRPSPVPLPVFLVV